MQVHICEDHNEVLDPLYRAIGSKKVPFEDNVLLHFDSHPDMLVAKGFDASKVFDKRKLFESLSIENWIMPILYAGHVNTVIWVKKSWCDQIKDGSYRFTVGRHTTSHEIKCTLEEPYFISELVTCTSDELENIKHVQLHVITVNDNTNTDESCPLSHIEELKDVMNENESVILDIDLDYFSTTNPFINLYSDDELSLFSDLYKYESQTDLPSALLHRREQLQTLRKYMNEYNKTEQQVIEDERYSKICRLLNSIQLKQSEQLDFDMIHEHGQTFDTSQLPHHISTSEQIKDYIKEFKEILTNLPKPAICLIARSSVDDYCPDTQVDLIQNLVVDVLHEHYTNIKITNHYLNT